LKPASLEDVFNKSFAINRKNKLGVFIYSKDLIDDAILFEFLLHAYEETVMSLSISNAILMDGGVSILSHFLQPQKNLQVFKVYNNVMLLVEKGLEIPLLIQSTSALAEAFFSKKFLHTIEVHGFFFSIPDLDLLMDSLKSCKSLKKLQFSNNSMQDQGVELLADVLGSPQCRIEHLSIYNNNCGDTGALALAKAMKINKTLIILNMQMNFIRKEGANAFIDGLRMGHFASIQKINLLQNQITEIMKKDERVDHSVIVL